MLFRLATAPMAFRIPFPTRNRRDATVMQMHSSRKASYDCGYSERPSNSANGARLTGLMMITGNRSLPQRMRCRSKILLISMDAPIHTSCQCACSDERGVLEIIGLSGSPPSKAAICLERIKMTHLWSPLRGRNHMILAMLQG